MEAAVGVLVAVAVFGVAEVMLSESGLFATLVLGLVLANQRVVPTVHISRFGETLEVLVIGTLFILLGALVEIELLVSTAGQSALVVVVLVVVVRPLAVGLSLLGSTMAGRDRAFAAWMNPRGIVAAAAAAQFTGILAAAGLDSTLMLPIAFGVILGTGIVYGLTGVLMARVLRVAAPRPTGVALLGSAPWLLELARCLQDLGASVLVLTDEPHKGDVQRDVSVPTASLLGSEAELRNALEATPLARALVATELQAVATLVIADLVERLGRTNVFVLPRHEVGAVERVTFEAWAPKPFAPDANLDEISQRAASGAAVKPCPDGVPDGAIPMAAVRPDGMVDLRPGLHRPDPRATVVALTGGTG